LLLRHLQNIAAKKRGTAIKQKTLKDFLWKFIIIIIYERQTALLYYLSFRLYEVASVHIALDNRNFTVITFYWSAVKLPAVHQ
jgi:hypothetical protein